MKIKSYKDLIVWQKAMELVKLVCKLTIDFPQEEKFGLVSQMRRAAVSVPSNIAEGFGRMTKREYGRFYSIAYGSVLELETQLTVSKDLKYGKDDLYREIGLVLTEVSKMLNKR